MTMTYRQAVEFLEGFIDYEKDRSSLVYNTQQLHLERFRQFLDHLGSPDREFRAIHLAGSKGKGSTAALLHAVLSLSGARCGMYSSPHLASYCERIRISDGSAAAVDSGQISEAEFGRAMARVREGIESFPHDPERSYRTAFELLTAAAFVAFAEAGVEWALIETGLGGRLDATNVIEPALVVITAIGRDHAEVLGHTIEEIAAEKCGIIKPNTPVILAPQPAGQSDAIHRVVRETCARQHAPLHLAAEEWELAFHDYGGFAMMPLALGIVVLELWFLKLLFVFFDS